MSLKDKNKGTKIEVVGPTTTMGVNAIELDAFLSDVVAEIETIKARLDVLESK